MIFEKIIVPRLEIHISDYCNLKCDNCNHFSNYGISGLISAEEYELWNRPWAKLLFPLNYQLLGGEPTTNHELVEICKLARKMWRKTPKIVLVSNGFFLNKHPELPVVLAENNIKLIISVHSNTEIYNEKLEEIKTLILNWQKDNKFKVHYRESYKNWVQTFKRDATGNTVPCNDGNPAQSFAKCLSKEAKQIYQGNLFKCPPMAYLNLVNKKFTLSDEWNFYLGYKPLAPDCTRKELEDFFALKEEAYCNMCAANPTSNPKNDPLVQLNLKKF